MLTQSTLINTNHDLITVPVGLIDDFTRDDGWSGDRPAACGNFWEDNLSLGYPMLISSNQLTSTPAGAAAYKEATIYLGGTVTGIQVDLDRTGHLTDQASISLFDGGLLTSDTTSTRFSLERFEVLITDSTVALYKRTTGGIQTSLFSTTWANTNVSRWYVTATPMLGATRVVVQQSNTDGSSLVTLFDAEITFEPAGRWAALGCCPGQFFDNAQRTTAPTVAYLFTDPFTRADSATTLGSPWTANQGTWGISSNQAYPVSGNDGDTATVDVSATDVTVGLTVATQPASKGTGVVARFVDVNNYYLLTCDSSAGNVGLYKKVAGTFTQLAVSGGSISNGDELRLRLTGSSVVGEVRRAGALLRTLSATDGALTSGTRVGIRVGYAGNSATRVDDFYAYS
jgi:hypothetical protein